MPISTQISGVRLMGHEKLQNVDDEIALDIPINFYVNDRILTTLFATPEDLEDLALGFMISEGLISDLNEINEIRVEGANIRVKVGDIDIDKIFNRFSLSRVILTSCGAIREYSDILREIKYNKSFDYRISRDDLLLMIKHMRRVALNYRRYIALHIACIYEGGKLKSIACDVNRHITVDKVIGKALRESTDFTRSILMTSGRQSADMILKAGRAGIPITVSLRGPLYSGLNTALSIGITTVALTHGKGFTIYTYPERIILNK